MKKGKKIIVILSVLCLVAAALTGGIILLKGNAEPPVTAVAVAGDVDWYDENEKEFVITTTEELYGVAELSKTYDFKGQTIKLGADIVINEGDAGEWAAKAPEYLWNPIVGFAGKFDGQGHTISGVYGNSIVTSLGLFTDTQKSCVIKNLNLVNSCFKNNNDLGTGSIIGVGGGKLENVYSDAVLTSSGKYVGGLIGRVITKGENQITNCWFDGTITMKGTDCSEVGGLVGAYTVEDAINVIEHSLSTADIVCMGENVGGICGNVGNGSFLNLSDSMYTGTLEYDANKYAVVGSVIGQIMGSASAIINDTYTVDEIANRTIGTNSGYQKGSVIAVGKAYLTGPSSYQWTTLDFGGYWAVQKDATPLLSYYAKTSESVDGIGKMVDISWYDQAGATFEITTVQQLYGFAYLSRSYDFRGQTIKLGADIIVNEGDAATWGEEAPAYNWTPIAWYGNSLSKRFKGTFDGQGHTISGIYAKGTENIDCVGLFGEIYHGAVVKDFKLVNSYFEGVLSSDVRGPVGSVAGRLRGTIENVYSDAIVVNSAKNTGGIVGMITGSGQNRIASCWFDGTLTGITRSGGILGGVYGNKGNIEATIEHCLNTGDIKVEIGQAAVGGICGTAETWSILYIDDCLNAGAFETFGEGEKESSHIGTLLGTVTQTGGVGSQAIISDSYGVKEFYSRLVGWEYADEGVSQSSVVFTNMEELNGYGGYRWTTLDFENNWAVRLEDVPVPVVFAESRPSVADVVRMVDYSWYDAGKDVYTISTFQQLYGMARLWDITNLFKNKTVLLGADITVNEGNASAWGENAPAFVWEPMKFRGTFDGQGHTISGIYVKGGEEDNYVGLFHRIYKGATVKNLKLTNSYFEGTMAKNERGAVGSIAGRSNGIIDTVYSDAIVVNSARMTGGLVGMITGEGENQILNSWFDGQITGINRTGGILGGMYGNKENIEATITNCLNTGNIAVKIGSGDVGGICGIAETWSTLYINDCLNAGTFETIGDDKEANTHIGTIFGSVTKTENVGSSVVMKNVYGVDDFYPKLVGWSYAKEGVSESHALLTSLDILKGSNGYQYTNLDFKNFWALNEERIPVPIAFGTITPEVSVEESLVDYDWYDADSDVYIISTSEQLLGFGALCNKDNDYFKGKTVKLGADITLNEGDAKDWAKKAPENVWIPVSFKGTFDGQGHTINGVYAKTDDTYTGFFTTINSGAVVKNLKLVNSYLEGTKTSGRNGVGSIAGRNLGTIDTVYSDAIVKNANGALMTGGIAGMSTGDTENAIINCWFDGEIYAGGSTGGILGGAYAANASIEHCLSTGTLSINDGSSAIGGLCGYVQSTSNVALKDSLSAGGLVTEGTVKQIGAIVGSLHNDGTLEVAGAYGNKEFSEKRIGYHSSGVLNKAADTTFAVWELEAFKGYGAYQCTTLDFEDEKAWVLRDEEIPGLSVFNDTNLDLTHAKTLANYNWYDADSDVYIISTPQQLYGFNLICNEDNDYFKGKTVKLGADITLNEGEAAAWASEAPENAWSPENFSGVFDGCGYTISGVYAKTTSIYTGFFKTINSGAVVKNLKLVNSYFEGTQTEGRCGTGSIAGRNLGTIDTVYSDAIVKNEKGALMTGGIAGMSTGSTENAIVNCWFDGEVYAGGSAGGILGGTYKATATIENCLNTGSLNINAGSSAVGGLLGYIQSTSDVVLSDSLNAGSMVQVGEGTIKQLGAVVGALHNDGALEVANAYGVSEFAEKKIGYLASGSLTQVAGSGFATRGTEEIKGYGAYQWMGLDFTDEKNWVLRNEEAPKLRVFSVLNLDLDYAKTLADYRWYDTELDEYIISTAKELYGFGELCTEENNCFAGKTIKLGADITLNEGEAAAWGEEAPANIWAPTDFSGTLDGQGHTLSGVYVKTTSYYTGFFKTMNSGAVVKNLKLVNSYFEGTQEGDNRRGTGSIAGQNLGTIDTVYSNAIVKNANGALMTGGIAGMSTGTTENTITNCWFDGQIYAGGSTGGILGGTYAATATVEHCLNTGVLNINAGTRSIGGLIGFVQSTSDVVLSDSLNVGSMVQVGDGTIKQLGSVVGALHNSGTLEVADAYGISEFAEKKLGYHENGVLNQVAGTAFAVRNLDDIKGYGAYQWMGLDFDAEKYWVLKDGEHPALNAFDDTNLDVEHAKTLTNYSWYDAESDEYIISTAQQLYGFNELCTDTNEYFAGKTIKLGANITLNEGNAADWANEAPDNKWAPTDFSGTFDGQGYTLSGVYAKTTGTYTGFFKIMNVGSVVKSLRLENSYFEGTKTTNDRRGTGSIAGQNGGTIDTVYSNAIVKNVGAKMTGGIAGMSSLAGENTIRNCWFDGQIYGSHDTGGILGGTYKATANIEHCLNTGVLYISAGKVDIGGLCGYIQNASTVEITDSLNAGSLVSTGDGTVSEYIGTIVGKLDTAGILTVKDTHGISEFSEKTIGYNLGTATLSANIVKASDAIKGYDAAQYTALDFCGEGYWVLKDGATPTLNVFDDTDLDLAHAKTLPNYSWYEADLDVYEISTPWQLMAFNELCNADDTDYFNGKTIKLCADIAYNEGTAADWADEAKAPTNTWTPLTFKGTLDGQGHTISGIYAKTTTTYTGFFNTINSGAVVKNLKLVNSYFEGTKTSGRSPVGSIAGRNLGTIDTVYSSAIVKNEKGGLMTGGIAGMSTGSTENMITNCWFDGQIYATGNTGGILGGAYAATANIEHCLNTGTLNIASGTAIGGLCGYGQNAATLTIKDSLNAGTYVAGDGTIKQLGTLVGAIHAKGTLTVGNVYGVSDFSDKLVGYSSSNVTQESGTAYELSEMANYYNRGASGLSFYADGQSSADDGDTKTCWWTAREGKLPMLESLLEFAESLEE